MNPCELESLLPELSRIGQGRGKILVISGAGLSAASGIPTFRGPEGYWTLGSSVYTPEEMATAAMFARHPEEVWAWYLYRLGVCRRAEPNSAHMALFDLHESVGDRLIVATQNVDGLHGRSGLPDSVLMELHGNIEWMRPFDESAPKTPLPAALAPLEKGQGLDEARKRLLRRSDGSYMRPHVLWFDECYDEVNYRWQSAQDAAASADLLIVIGSSGTTNLPRRMASIAAARGTLIIDINPEPSPFARAAQEETRGAWLQGTAGHYLPRLLGALRSS
jgi:NAD-dependent protein deacetylase/lipoamidase